MDLKNLFCRPNKILSSRPRETGKMTGTEKKQLLSNDFIGRMIAVEQRVSSSFGEYIPYKKTCYYQSLTASEKKNFDKYQKNKKKLWKAAIGMFFILFIGIAIFKMNFTGYAVDETISAGINPGTSYIILAGMLVGFFIIGIIFVLKKKKEREFNKKFEIINKIVSLRRFRREEA
jgi:hypothetical protein